MKHSKSSRNYRGKQKFKRHFSIPFLLAILGNFVIGALCLISFVWLFTEYLFEEKIWAVFATGFVGALMIVGSSGIARTRTFIHETKHAIMVVLTGNLVKSFHVEKHTGHVGYQMYSDKVHFAPLISLAPYFFPMFSLPMLILCLLLEDYDKLLLALGLGLSLGADLALAYGELHEHQTDLQKVTGGVFAGLLYLAGFHFMWVTTCLLWVAAGLNGYLHAGYVVVEVVKQLAVRLAPFLG